MAKTKTRRGISKFMSAREGFADVLYIHIYIYIRACVYTPQREAGEFSEVIPVGWEVKKES